MKVSKLFWQTLFVSALILGISVQLYAQVVLPEITVTAARYKYLNAVNPEEAAQPVNMLEHYVAAYDVKSAEFYEEQHDNYFVSFYIPEGKILAVYSKDGEIIRTIEHFKNAGLPSNVLTAVTKRFPNWAITEDVYLVKYYREENLVTKKIYKLLLENGDKRMRVKVNDQAEFL